MRIKLLSVLQIGKKDKNVILCGMKSGMLRCEGACRNFFNLIHKR